MRRGVYILLHALAASAFVFAIQTYALKQPLETARMWAIAFGVAAALLAWHQTQR